MLVMFVTHTDAVFILTFRKESKKLHSSFLGVSLSVYLSIIYLSIYLSVNLPTYVHIYLIIYLIT